MDGTQYEELCRRFIAEKEGLARSDVKSVRIPNPQRPGLPAYEHQIDLYWETGSNLATYLNIANAKWRGTRPIEQGDLLLLQQVRQKVGAHKAFVVTNAGYTPGAIAVAKDEGIALHIVRPIFDSSVLPKSDRAAIQAKLDAIAAEQARPMWSHQVEHKGHGFHRDSGEPDGMRRQALKPGSLPCETRVVQTPRQQTSAPPDSRLAGGKGTRADPRWESSGDGRGRVEK